VGHGLHRAVQESIRNKLRILLLEFIKSMMTVFTLGMFSKHGFFLIDFSVGMAGISIFIQNKKLRHIR